MGAAVAIGGASLLVRGLVDIRVALAHVPSAFWVLAVLAVVADSLRLPDMECAGDMLDARTRQAYERLGSAA